MKRSGSYPGSSNGNNQSILRDESQQSRDLASHKPPIVLNDQLLHEKLLSTIQLFDQIFRQIATCQSPELLASLDLALTSIGNKKQQDSSPRYSSKYQRRLASYEEIDPSPTCSDDEKEKSPRVTTTNEEYEGNGSQQQQQVEGVNGIDEQQKQNNSVAVSSVASSLSIEIPQSILTEQQCNGIAQLSGYLQSVYDIVYNHRIAKLHQRSIFDDLALHIPTRCTIDGLDVAENNSGSGNDSSSGETGEGVTTTSSVVGSPNVNNGNRLSSSAVAVASSSSTLMNSSHVLKDKKIDFLSQKVSILQDILVNELNHSEELQVALRQTESKLVQITEEKNALQKKLSRSNSHSARMQSGAGHSHSHSHSNASAALATSPSIQHTQNHSLSTTATASSNSYVAVTSSGRVVLPLGSSNGSIGTSASLASLTLATTVGSGNGVDASKTASSATNAVVVPSNESLVGVTDVVPSSSGRNAMSSGGSVVSDNGGGLTTSGGTQLVWDRPSTLVGLYVRKTFGDRKYFGVVTGYKRPYFMIVYDDGDNEEIDKRELRDIMWDGPVPSTRVATLQRHWKRLEAKVFQRDHQEVMETQVPPVAVAAVAHVIAVGNNNTNNNIKRDKPETTTGAESKPAVNTNSKSTTRRNQQGENNKRKASNKKNESDSDDDLESMEADDNEADDDGDSDGNDNDNDDASEYFSVASGGNNNSNRNANNSIPSTIVKENDNKGLSSPMVASSNNLATSTGKDTQRTRHFLSSSSSSSSDSTGLSSSSSSSASSSSDNESSISDSSSSDDDENNKSKDVTKNDLESTVAAPSSSSSKVEEVKATNTATTASVSTANNKSNGEISDNKRQRGRKRKQQQPISPTGSNSSDRITRAGLGASIVPEPTSLPQVAQRSLPTTNAVKLALNSGSKNSNQPPLANPKDLLRQFGGTGYFVEAPHPLLVKTQATPRFATAATASTPVAPTLQTSSPLKVSAGTASSTSNTKMKVINLAPDDDTSSDDQPARSEEVNNKDNEGKTQSGYMSSISDPSSEDDGSSDSDAIVITVNNSNNKNTTQSVEPSMDVPPPLERKRTLSNSGNVVAGEASSGKRELLPSSPESKKPRIIIDLSI